jgi:hypothetical protein
MIQTCLSWRHAKPKHPTHNSARLKHPTEKAGKTVLFAPKKRESLGVAGLEANTAVYGSGESECVLLRVYKHELRRQPVSRGTTLSENPKSRRANPQKPLANTIILYYIIYINNL